MHGPTLAATLAAAVWLGSAPAALASAEDKPPTDAAAAIVRARGLLARDDPKGAIALLQPALSTAGADLGPMIVVLRQAYTRAADTAAKAGRAEEAEDLREDLQILNRKMRGRPDEPKSAPKAVAPAMTPAPTPSPAPVAPPAKVEEPGPIRPEIGFEDAPPPPKSAEPAPAPSPLPLAEPAPNVPDPLAITAPTPNPEGEPVRPRTQPDAAPPFDAAITRAGQSEGSASTGERPMTPLDRPAATPPPVQPDLLAMPGLDSPPSRSPAAIPASGRPRTTPEETVAPESPRASAAPTPADALKAADTAYLKGLYLEANVQYAVLAKAGRLPEGRKIHWAYCRSVDVVRRLKANPSTAQEWAAIDREIAEIKALSPKYWYAEYLRNRAADMARGQAKGPAPKGRVVRGAMPESGDSAPARIRDLTRPVPAVPAQPPVGRMGKPGAFAMAVPSTETPPVVTSNGESGRWQVKETANFLILHDDPALADAVAKSAEAAREAMTRRWTGSPPPRAWEPKCEIYLYPTAAIFAQVTGQPADSPGFSTMESNGAAITGRRIKLRADAANLVAAVVPHEVTHVLLADLFPARQIPRWADEGISVLSEPAPEQERRIGELDAALDGGKIFAVENLMVNDYPEGKYWPLYYAQSVSLTRFLVDKGKPGQFIDFLQGSQRNGIEPELRRVYGIENYADLQTRWLAYARESSAARVAAKGTETRTR